jgi:hypothetical protein
LRIQQGPATPDVDARQHSDIVEDSMLISLLVIVAGVLITWNGARKKDAARRYEFENRSSGGTVGFSSYDASKKHEKQKYGATMISGFGNILILFGVLGLVVSCAMHQMGGHH